MKAEARQIQTGRANTDSHHIKGTPDEILCMHHVLLEFRTPLKSSKGPPSGKTKAKYIQEIMYLPASEFR